MGAVKKGASKKAAANKKGKALKAAQSVKKGKHTHRAAKLHTSVHFHRPKTLPRARKPQYPRRSVVHTQLLKQMDQFRVVRYPLTTESVRRRLRTTTPWSSSSTAPPT